MVEVKSINSLMKYMRDEHNIKIEGSTHKNKLRNMGYYHGFKGYRFIKESKNTLKFNNFNEIIAMNKLDADLKSIIYPKIMLIETSIKNRVLENILLDCKKSDFNSIYEQALTGYKEFKKTNERKGKLINRLKLRDQILSSLTREFSKGKKVIEHFYSKELNVPIWAIFEVITMGELGNFISCLKKELRVKISKDINLNTSVDTNGILLQNIIFLLKDLRNAVAHNNIVFDIRFKTSNANEKLKKAFSFDIGINYDENDNFFTNIFDYVILIIYLLKGLGISKKELKKFISDFESITEEFRNNIDVSIYNRIFTSSLKYRIKIIKEFIKK